MVSYPINPEEEEKESRVGHKQAPIKDVEDICATLEACIHDAAQSQIDFLEYLQDAAMNTANDEDDETLN